MVDKSKADLDKDGKVSEYESKRADAAFGDTPINMTGPLYAKDKPMSDKKRARRKKRVQKLEAKVIKNSELKPIKGVADEDLQYTAKKGKEKKVSRLSKKSNRISAKTTKILRDNNQVPSAKKKPVVAKAKSSSKKIPKVKKTKGFVKKDYGRDLELIEKISKGPAKKKKTPVKFANAAQRKAVWASKNEKKKK
jgi:hypothetical protein